MRNIRAERKIEKYLSGRFQLDSALFDVTVINDQAEITGVLARRIDRKRLEDREIKDVQRFFRRDTVPGVDSYYFHLHEHTYI